MKGTGDVKAALAPRSLFAALPEHLVAGLFGKAPTIRLRAHQLLFSTGDAGGGCYRVEQGLLKVSVASSTGAERILAILGPASVVGELSMIDGSPRSAGVTALRDSELSYLSAASFNAFAEQHPEVYRHLVVLLAQRLRDTNAVVAASSFLPLKGRVARALLSLAEAFGRDVGSRRILIHQKVTQSELASMAGIARENVSRILNEWRDAGIVSRLSSYYCLDDLAALEREAQV